MTRHERGGSTVKRSLPDVGTAVGLVGGLVVLLFGPLPTSALDLPVGGTLLAAVVVRVAYLIAGVDGPGERGPRV